mgnify:CR=1 FL=1
MGFLDRLRQGLSRTKEQLVSRFEQIVQRADDTTHRVRPVDVETIEILRLAQHDAIGIPFTRQHLLRQWRSVVGRLRLCADECDATLVPFLAQRLAGAQAGEGCADHHDVVGFHRPDPQPALPQSVQWLSATIGSPSISRVIQSINRTPLTSCVYRSGLLRIVWSEPGLM